jgi:alginate O-acetyltransferase complex protein AlgI
MVTIQFFAILLASLLVYWLLPVQRFRNWVLILASFGYIYLTDKWSIVVVIGLTLFSYAMGIAIARSKKSGIPHFIGVVGVLSLLIVFKYLGFLTGIINSLLAFSDALPRFEINKLIMPFGISYIVFKHISYLTDIKWGLVKPGGFDGLLLYSSLFTIFVAGPIERFERFKPQADQLRIKFEWLDIEFGFRRIVFGMFKKLVIADWIGYFINPVWQHPDNYISAIKALALIGFSFQIYFDFSGYSDIAIGASRLFGFRIMENFRNPYLAPNISQFWRRWHISLSDWIRDYVFFPLSRISNKRFWLMFCTPVTAMALCGLWHGAAWHYIWWGVWHGVGLAGYQVWNEYKRKHKKLSIKFQQPLVTYSMVILNFCFVTIGWWLFR